MKLTVENQWWLPLWPFHLAHKYLGVKWKGHDVHVFLPMVPSTAILNMGMGEIHPIIKKNK